MVLSRSSGKSYKQQIVNYSTTYNFDLETAFLFPWGVALRDIGWFGYASMVIFLLEFIVGFVYIWKKGALDWE